SSLITSRRPARFRASTVTCSPAASRIAPGENSVSFSLASSTTKEPSRPCGRPTRPTRTSSSLNDLEQDPPVALGAARADDGAESSGDAAASPDHAADVVRGDAQPDDERAVLLDLLDADGVGVLDEPPSEVLDQVGGRHSIRTRSPAAKSKRRKDAGSARSRRLRARLRTQRGAALQGPEAPG